jgi:septum site-determining protein MinD
MVECIVFHSARSGVGKSTVAANVAVLLAAQGRRVGLVDANLQDGGLALFFGLPEIRIDDTLNDFLLERCDGTKAFYEVTPPSIVGGRLLLLPASSHPRDLTSLVRQGFRVERMTDDLLRLAETLRLDTLLIDTHAGLQEQTQLSILALAMAQTLLIVLRLDQRDYQGTGVSIDVARALRVRKVALVVNQIAASFNPASVKESLEAVYDDKVLALLPYEAEIAALASADLFVLRHPKHSVTRLLEQIAGTLIQNSNSVVA